MTAVLAWLGQAKRGRMTRSTPGEQEVDPGSEAARQNPIWRLHVGKVREHYSGQPFCSSSHS
jgi:hypothetical protein